MAPAKAAQGPADSTVRLSPPPDGALLTVRPRSGWSALALSEVWQFRDLLFTLSSRDLKLRYKQTALGVVWVVLQPLMAAGIFTVVFGKIAKLGSEGAPNYFVFAFAGQLGWNLFANTLTKASGCLVGNAHLISKVYFPRLILPLSSVPSTFVDLAVSAGMMIALMVIYHIVPGWPLLLLPVWMAILLGISMGIGLISSAMSVSYRDISYILPVFLQMLMYASPVAYGVSEVPASVKLFFSWNPLSQVLVGFRWSLLNTTAPPEWTGVGYAAFVAAGLMILGSFSFKRMERKFADIV